MEIKWYGTASIEIKNRAGSIMFDPFVPLKGSEINTKIEDYDNMTDVFITHGHLDHIASIPEIFKRNPNMKIYCTQTPYTTLRKKGIPESNLVQMTYGSELSVYGFRIQVYHGKHAVLPKPSIKRVSHMLKSPDRRNIPNIVCENALCRENDETVFYQIEAEGKTISLMGSLNLREEIDYPVGSDFLILPYNGWEDNFTPAVGAVERLKPKKILLDHYDDTFPPVTTPVNLSPILEKYKNMAEAMSLKQVYTI